LSFYTVCDPDRWKSTADCSIAFKFGTEFDLVTGDTMQMFQVKGQGSQRKVMYEQQKRY